MSSGTGTCRTTIINRLSRRFYEPPNRKGPAPIKLAPKIYARKEPLKHFLSWGDGACSLSNSGAAFPQRVSFL